MLKEKNPLLHIDIKEEELDIKKIMKYIFKSLYIIFDLILENPIENFWYEFMAIIISYIQILFCLFEKTVSKLIKY